MIPKPRGREAREAGGIAPPSPRVVAWSPGHLL